MSTKLLKRDEILFEFIQLTIPECCRGYLMSNYKCRQLEFEDDGFGVYLDKYACATLANNG